MSSERQEGEMGRRFGPYELVRKLGRGGMAETYEAVRRHGGVVQRVCVKCILPHFESDAEFVELFLREARISSTLRHANVVQVLDFGEQAGRHYLVLELVDGVDLRNLLRQLMGAGERLPGGVLAHIAVELAQALDYAHAARPDGSVEGVVHRDISPSNVLLSPTGDVKLTDFGVAKAMGFTSYTRGGAVKGKIPYMAPEYARGGACDARSDLFSLGVLLYECAAGRRPFDGASEVSTLERAHSGRHVPLQDLASEDLPPALVQAIEALIARDPDDRPTTAGQLLERLGDATPPPS
ncbi:MAG: serine/threonine protein kinase, partial [Deltaproteobacteria bacterium]|nr:serine/threonine protein kinase [Deltaproteobacteria bacterium]